LVTSIAEEEQELPWAGIAEAIRKDLAFHQKVKVIKIRKRGKYIYLYFFLQEKKIESFFLIVQSELAIRDSAIA